MARQPKKPKVPVGPAQSSFVADSHGRHPDDFYSTPPDITMALCEELVLRGVRPETIIDVGSGNGAIGMVLRQYFGRSWIVGIEPNLHRWRASLDSHAGQNGHTYNRVDRMDWTGVGYDERPDWSRVGPRQEPAQLIVFNSPFRHSLRFMELSLERIAPGGHIASLLISQWDQETVHDDERGRFLDSLRKPDGSEGYGQLKYKGRVDCRGNGRTDRVGYKWLIIGPGFEGQFVRVPRSPTTTSTQMSLL